MSRHNMPQNLIDKVIDGLIKAELEVSAANEVDWRSSGPDTDAILIPKELKKADAMSSVHATIEESAASAQANAKQRIR